MSRSSSSKSQIFLMEFICVVLFFSICAALCINCFVKADQMSKGGRQLNEALLVAQTVAENIKGMEAPDKNQIRDVVEKINKNNKQKYMVEVEEEVQSDILTAKISVYTETNKDSEICSLAVKKYLPSGVEYAE